MSIRLSKPVLLRLFLVYTAVGWGICTVGIFISTVFGYKMLHFVGGVDTGGLSGDPMYDYWFRMASSVFGLIGIFYFFLALKPEKYAVVMPFAGWFMIIEGVVLLIHGVRLELPPTPWYGDVGFCLVGGLGILLCMNGKQRKNVA